MTLTNQHQQWLQRRIRIHFLWQLVLIGAWIVSLVGVFLLFTVGLPWFREALNVPDVVAWVTVGGVLIELLILLLISAIVTVNKRRLKREYESLDIAD